MKENNDKFDENLLEEIRLCFGGWILRGNNFEIVPKELTHSYLLNNFSPSEQIKEYYYSPCRDMFTDKDFEYFKSTGYVGNPKTTLDIYPFCFDGAFIQRKQLYYRIASLISRTENYNNKPLKSFIDLFPYFEDYGKGFKVGFESFEDDCIKKFLPMFADKSDFVNKTFEYVNKHVIFSHSWRNNHSGFKVSKNIQQKFDSPGEIIEAFEDGKFQGYFYRAWSIILSNVNLFESLFSEITNVNAIDSSIISDILYASHTMQQNKIFWNADEDTKTRQLLDLLPNKYQVKDQSKYGKSSVGKKAGSVDGVIKHNEIDIFVEAFSLKSLNRKIIKTHIHKLELNYDSKGLKEKFIIIYYNLAVNKFENSVKKYKEYIENEHLFVFPLFNEIEEIEVNYTDS
ncbi:hypothetical protein, partial [Flavobacterium sp. PL002]|uniref:hypothetical protein n=1 Tax=Flavobacterium sp. PL002 TaxID=1897058 RepID=UPI0017879922